MPSSLTDHSEYASIPYTPAPSNNLKESHKEASSAASYSPLPLMISHCPLNPPSTSHCMQMTSSSTLPALTLLPLKRRLQLTLTHCSEWATSHGFTFSPSKSSVILFTRPWSRSNPLQPLPSLFLHRTPIPVRTTHRFLGVTFDTRLTYKPHITALRTSCHRLLNMFAHISQPRWSLNRQSLLRLYKSLVCSRIEYGCEIYSQATPSSLSPLASVQNRALRLAIGAFI